MESLERRPTERNYATARLAIICRWGSAQVTHALNQDIHADFVAELPGIERTLTQYARERAMLSDALGVEEQWRSEKLGYARRPDCEAQVGFGRDLALLEARRAWPPSQTRGL